MNDYRFSFNHLLSYCSILNNHLLFNWINTKNIDLFSFIQIKYDYEIFKDISIEVRIDIIV